MPRKLVGTFDVFRLHRLDDLGRRILRQEFSRNPPLKVINAPPLEQILCLLRSQNVLPFVLPFAYAIGKLQVFRGFFGRGWCGREERTIQVFLRTASDSILRVAGNATQCPTICHNRQYARHVPRWVAPAGCAARLSVDHRGVVVDDIRSVEPPRQPVG